MNNMKELRRKKRINVSISLIFIWASCIGIYLSFLYIIKINSIQIPNILVYSSIILTSETVLCLFMWAYFMIKIDWLKDLNTGKEITYLNISNVLSALRFSLVPLLIVIFGLIPKIDGHFKLRIGIFIFAFIVCMTDMFDGILARKLNQVTKLGMVLDPMGDFLMITCFSVLLFVNGIIDWWYFSLIMFRIPGLFIATLFYMAVDLKFKLKTTLLGRTTIFYVLSHLGLCSFKFLLNFENSFFDTFLFITQIIGTILLAISSVEKIILSVYYARNQDKLSRDNLQF